MTTVHITIDGTSFTTRDDDQEAGALLRLAGRDPAHFDLFLVEAHGIETHIDDGQIVDLHDGATFRSRHKIGFTIDGTPYVTYDDDRTAFALLKLAGVDPALRTLTREAHGVFEAFTDEQLINIADGDRFETAERRRDVTIVVNTRPHHWADQRISYSQVVELAYPGQPITAEQDVTVRYSYRNGHGHGGTITAGHNIEVKGGMVFDVHRTTRS